MRIAFVGFVAAALLQFAVAAQSDVTNAVAAEDYGSILPAARDSFELQAQERDRNEPDITETVLWTLAAVGAAAVVSLIGYAIRRRVGFWLHRPPPRNGTASEEHH